MSVTLTETKLYTLDPTAVEKLVARYRAPMEYFAMTFVGDSAFAEDVVSEAIVRLLIKKPSLRDERALKTYLYTATKNAAIDFLRKRKREKNRLEEEKRLALADIRYIEESVVKNEEQKSVLSALKVLREEYREALYLQFFEGFSVDEICAVTGKKKKQVYNVLARAKTALAAILKKEEKPL